MSKYTSLGGQSEKAIERNKFYGDNIKVGPTIIVCENLNLFQFIRYLI
jgi:hypothetical protein